MSNISTITVRANTANRNVAENALKDLKLYPNTVLFGINGSGKTTVCETIANYSELRPKATMNNKDLKVFAFDDNWRNANVGDFIIGGKARSVTTVRLGDDAAQLEMKIKEEQSALKNSVDELQQQEQKVRDLEKEQEAVLDRVFNGTRKSLENRCSGLNGRSFNRRKIREILENQQGKLLDDNQVEALLRIVQHDAPDPLPPVPIIDSPWKLEDHIWDKVIARPDSTKTDIIQITNWIKEGLSQHQPGQQCEFCNGIVTKERLRQIEAAINQAESSMDPILLDALEKCKIFIDQLERCKDSLNATQFSESVYGGNLENEKSKIIRTITKILPSLHEIRRIITSKKDNPHSQVIDERPLLELSEFLEALSSFEHEYTTTQTKIRNHTDNQKRALKDLQRHCCATDGIAWEANQQLLESANENHRIAIDEVRKVRENITELESQISTTADTANFLNDSLASILGNSVLKVSEGDQGEGYRITRHGEKADGMSEGEKKLVSLLYFCAEFRTQERKACLSNSIVLFDDLGSELDEARMLTADRFISDFFQKSRPAAICYFTHSHQHLKILQDRLGSKAVLKSDGKLPTACFYEIYKDTFSSEQLNTKYRKWDDEAINLTNDYWLSFYMALRAFERLQDGGVPDVGTGNFCRKVLEGFTEFRFPANDNFGSRIQGVISEEQISLSPSLSKLVNGLSHSGLGRSGGALSRSEMERALIDTLEFMRAVDEKHFRSLLKKFRGKTGARNILRSLDTLRG